MKFNNTIRLISFAFLLIMACCSGKKEIDLLIYNGTIYTADSTFSIVSAMAVDGGKIIDLGDQSRLLRRYNPHKKVDLNGSPVYPGFIDAHCHFHGYGLMQETKADLVGVASPAEMMSRLINFHEVHVASSVIVGRGWDQNLWPNKEYPNKSLLDSVFPDIPVLLTRIDGHAMLVNSKALDVAGINRNTVVEGGEVQLENGEPSGILIDNAMDLVKDLVPQPTPDIIKLALKRAQEDCFAVGITMVADAGLSFEMIDAISEMQTDGNLLMRMYIMVEPDTYSLERLLNGGIINTSNLIVRSIKLYADGALGSRGALLLEPYTDAPESKGIAMMPWDKMHSLCKMAYDNGIQMNIHAIGDSAVRQVLQIYSDFLLPNNDLRWRIEHAQVVHPDDIHMFGQLNIIPSIQTLHATSDMSWAGERLGDRLATAYTYKELMMQNDWLPNGTDFPIENINPIHSFYSAVYRQNIDGYPEGGFQIENALSPEQALKSMTSWAAKACFAEDRIGSLEIGKCADFVILSLDILKESPDQVRKAEVVETFLNGKSVFKK